MHHKKSLMSDRGARRGFSLIEVLIVIAIASSIVFIVSAMNNNVSALNRLISQELQSKSDITQTLQIVTSEIRSAGPSQNGAYAIDSASTSSFAFYTSLHKNGVMEHVRYFLASSTIYKGVIEPTGTPAAYPTASESVIDTIDNISVSTSSPLFQYYDASYTGTQAPMPSPVVVPNIRMVYLSFIALIAPTQAGQVTVPQPFSTLIDIRNLRSN